MYISFAKFQHRLVLLRKKVFSKLRVFKNFTTFSQQKKLCPDFSPPITVLGLLESPNTFGLSEPLVIACIYRLKHKGLSFLLY